MKNVLPIPALILIGTFLTVSCSNEEDSEPIMGLDPISFEGTWNRQFEAGPGNWHNVSYKVYQDSIRYTLSGSVGQANYVLLRDTFMLQDQRYIGHTPQGTHYLIFVKDATDQSITLYKQPIENISEGMTLAVPPADTQENHGWNTYEKQ
ncbi:MAG: hypothetical protein AAGC45_09860 [Bacteroidota bacterium]